MSYLGLNPSVHQSGDHPAYHGHITHVEFELLPQHA
ncbi:hypothetical protein QTI66_31585 [Variovorax sp. J22R133]|nr:hypothetical protein [Variovorax sp. J22R133]MDM0116684.1 hypothetical protein [Variovorax sp. J22R133]